MVSAQNFETRFSNVAVEWQPAVPCQGELAQLSALGRSTKTSRNGRYNSISTILTNIQLLDLDLLPDWPDIWAETFASSPTVAPISQKKRVQCAEWVLYRLMEVWDICEANVRAFPLLLPINVEVLTNDATDLYKKLRPLFPPVDQAQSLTFRAALLRVLDDAKKNGTLCREVVIRKTMLDECKGERFENLLASVSTAALRAAAGRQCLAHTGASTVAVHLALDNRGYTRDNSDICTLALSYKISLRRHLEQREKERARYSEFSAALAVLERKLRSRQIAVGAKKPTAGTLSNHDVENNWKTVKSNWPRNDKWLTMLLGDPGYNICSILLSPFDLVWRHVQHGTMTNWSEEDGDGLLERLDDRVAMHWKRLDKWAEIRNQIFSRQPISEPFIQRIPDFRRDEPQNPIDFRIYDDLQTEKARPQLTDKDNHCLRKMHDYIALVDELHSDIAQLRGLGLTRFMTSQGAQNFNWSNSCTEETRKVRGREKYHKLDNTKEWNTDMRRIISASIAQQVHSPEAENNIYDQTVEGKKIMHTINRNLRSQPLEGQLQDAEMQLQRIDSATTQRAETTPGPSKSSSNGCFLFDESIKLPLEPSAVSHGGNIPDFTPQRISAKFAEEEELSDLVSRTGLSLAISKNGMKTREEKSFVRPRASVRMMMNQDSNHHSHRLDEGPLTRNDLAEELMLNEDMEAVFRPRPKIKASSIPSSTQD